MGIFLGMQVVYVVLPYLNLSKILLVQKGFFLAKVKGFPAGESSILSDWWFKVNLYTLCHYHVKPVF